MNEGLSLLVSYISEYKIYKHNKRTLNTLYIVKDEKSVPIYKLTDKQYHDIGNILLSDQATTYLTWKESYKKHGKKDGDILINNAIKKYKKRIKTLKTKLYHLMQLFLMFTLPDAYVKREFDLELNALEEALLMELIPKTYNHEIWDVCEYTMTKYLTYIKYQYCRRCGKKKTNEKFRCLTCKLISYCSGKCNREDLQDKAFGHDCVECIIFKNNKIKI